MASPMQIATAPKITVQRMPKRCAIRPMATPPTEVPIQASETASDGTERAPPSSAAIGFKPTAAIQSAPNEVASSATDTVATIQEDRVSRLGASKTKSRQVGVARRRVRDANIYRARIAVVSWRRRGRMQNAMADPCRRRQVGRKTAARRRRFIVAADHQGGEHQGEVRSR